MHKTKILIGIILVIALIFAGDFIFAEKPKKPHPDDFVWKIKIINKAGEKEVYFTNEPVVKRDYWGIRDIKFWDLYRYKEKEKRWSLERLTGGIDFLNVPMIIIERAKDHKEHRCKIKDELESPDNKFWRIDFPLAENLAWELTRSWSTQTRPMYSVSNFTGRATEYYNYPQAVCIEYPYIQFGNPDNGNGIEIPLIKSITFLGIPAKIIRHLYTSKNRIFVFHYSLENYSFTW